VTVVTANDRIGQVEIFDDGLQLALVVLGHLAPKDGGDFVGLSDIAIEVQQALGEVFHGRSP